LKPQRDRNHPRVWWVLSAVTLGVFTMPAHGRAEKDRPIRVAPLVGARMFASPLELNSEFAFGARVSIGVSDRVCVVMDAGHSSPVRKTTGASMSFGEIRLLTTVRVLRGPVCPYVLAGLGGQFFNFHDTAGAASGLLAAGLGVEVEATRRWSFFAEGSGDIYRASFSGSDYGSWSSRQTYVTGLYTFGAQYEF